MLYKQKHKTNEKEERKGNPSSGKLAITTRDKKHSQNTTKMQYVAAYILSAIGGNAEEAKVKEILGAAGAEIDEGKIKEVFDAMNGKDVWEVIAAGKSQMGSMAVAAAPAAGAAAATTTEEAPKEEEKKEEEEEEDDFGGFGDLF